MNRLLKQIKRCGSALTCPSKLFYLAAFILTILNRVIEPPDYIAPYVNSFLDDVLTMPFALGAILIERAYFRKDTSYTISIKQVTFAFIYFSILFEVIVPAFSPTSTGDVFDILAYGIGTVLFCLFINFSCPFQPTFMTSLKH